MSKVKVPEGMQKAAEFAVRDHYGDRHYDREISVALEAALGWLAEHPIVPTDEEAKKILAWLSHRPHNETSANDISLCQRIINEWQRRMFLEPEPEVPEAIKDKIWVTLPGDCRLTIEHHNANIIEAYRRGREFGIEEGKKSRRPI